MQKHYLTWPVPVVIQVIYSSLSMNNHLVSLQLQLTSDCVCVKGKETTEEEDEVAVGMDKGFMDEFFEQVCCSHPLKDE